MFYYIIDIGNFITAIITISPVIKYIIDITISPVIKYITVCKKRFVCKKRKSGEEKKIEIEPRKPMYMNTSRIIKKNKKL